MIVFDNKHIKNVALVGAHHFGKTTLTETMLFEAELISRSGSTEQQNTILDDNELEHQLGASVFATTLHNEWRNYKINLIAALFIFKSIYQANLAMLSTFKVMSGEVNVNDKL